MRNSLHEMSGGGGFINPLGATALKNVVIETLLWADLLSDTRPVELMTTVSQKMGPLYTHCR